MGRPIKDRTGERYGQLTAIEVVGQTERKEAVWRCECDCGQVVDLRGGKLTRGQQSCGCLRGKREYDMSPLAHRFWPNVHVTDGCWEWTGAIDETVGYGRVGLGRREDGTMGAHRVAYMLAIGPIPDDVVLHHRCENPPCVRPDHLEPLTRAEHMELHREEISR